MLPGELEGEKSLGISGKPQIEVSFDLDANGILNVKAVDKGTGKEQSIKIESSSGISDDDIERMKRDAEAHAAEDKARRDEVETRNRADQLCYSVEKTLEETKDKVPEDKATAIKDKIASLRSAIESQDAEAIKSGTEELEKLMHEIAATAYQGAGDGAEAAGGANGAPEGEGGAKKGEAKSGKQDEVIDAEFEES